jgi:thymidylate synthase
MHWTDSGSLVISAGSVPGTVVKLANALSRPGTKICAEAERRGGKMREVPGVALLEVRDPRRRLSILQGRQADPWVSLCEFPWLIAGRADVSWVGRFLPRARDFSDDGKVWRAGYGPRLRAWRSLAEFAHQTEDQLAAVVRELIVNPATRQAVVSLWDPMEDLGLLGVKFKDYPCTNWMHFQIKNGKLDLTVTMRSNDLIWGYSGVNAVNFTLLQELVASLVGVELGVYRHVCDNMHVYERHFSRLPEMAVSRNIYELMRSHPPRMFDDLHGQGLPGLASFTSRCAAALNYAEGFLEARHGRLPSMEGIALTLGVHSGSFLAQWTYAMCLREAAAEGSWQPLEFFDAIEELSDASWALSMAGWTGKRHNQEVLISRAVDEYAGHGCSGHLFTLIGG